MGLKIKKQYNNEEFLTQVKLLSSLESVKENANLILSVPVFYREEYLELLILGVSIQDAYILNNSIIQIAYNLAIQYDQVVGLISKIKR